MNYSPVGGVKDGVLVAIRPPHGRLVRSKGRRIYVEGRLTTREYEAKDGSGKGNRTEIIARQIRFLDRRRDASAAAAAGEQSIPF